MSRWPGVHRRPPLVTAWYSRTVLFGIGQTFRRWMPAWLGLMHEAAFGPDGGRPAIVGVYGRVWDRAVYVQFGQPRRHREGDDWVGGPDTMNWSAG